jgi:hypothetical protein
MTKRFVGAIECFNIFLLRSKRCFWVRVRVRAFVSSCLVLGLAWATRAESTVNSCLKERGEYSVLALYSGY